VFGSKDPRPFVLDEVAGMLIAGLAAWTPWNTWTPLALAIAFFWFRVTDVIKPPPVRQLERLPGAWGILMDDVAAGLMALALAIPSLVVWNGVEGWLRGP
jgi:phosphatidylglycerophosphatase A